MPLTPDGAISLNDIRVEFGGGTGAVGINLFYRGGGRVPNDAFCHNNTIPASGPISFGNFRATTNGLTYADWGGGAGTYSPPINSVRSQLQIGAGGGGGTAAGRAAAARGGTNSWSAAAGGGGGGYSFYQIALNRNAGDYMAFSVGGGAGGVGGDPQANSGGGGSSAVTLYASTGAGKGTWTAGGGGGSAAGNSSTAGGGGGWGASAFGGGGTAQFQSRTFNPANASGGGGGSGFGGAGGGAYCRVTDRRGYNGAAGRVRMRF